MRLRYTRLALLAAAVLVGTPAVPRAEVPGPAPVQGTPGLVVSVAQPNPFATTSRFVVQSRRTQVVRAELHNLLGQRVKTLFEGRLDAGESRTVTIQADDLPPGLYLYRVQGDRDVVARQVVLNR